MFVFELCDVSSLFEGLFYLQKLPYEQISRIHVIITVVANK
jgi:hypothetical protein